MTLYSHLKWELANSDLWAKSGPTFVFAYRESFTGTQPSIFVYILSMAVFATVTDLRSCDRSHMACKAKNIHYLVLYRDSLLTHD